MARVDAKLPLIMPKLQILLGNRNVIFNNNNKRYKFWLLNFPCATILDFMTSLRCLCCWKADVLLLETIGQCGDVIMYHSNQSFNIPSPAPGNPPGIWIFGKFLFKCPPPRTEKLFKCPHPQVSSGVRFSKDPKTSRARRLFGALFGWISRVPESVSQRARKHPGFSPEFFGLFSRVCSASLIVIC